MKTKNIALLLISILFLVSLFFCINTLKEDNRMQQGLDETLALNLVSIDQKIDSDMGKLKVMELYFDEDNFADFCKKKYLSYDTEFKTIHAIAKSNPIYKPYELKKLSYFLLDLDAKAEEKNLTKEDLDTLLNVFHTWQVFKWEQLDANSAQSEYYDFEKDTADLKDAIQKICAEIPEV